MVVQTFSGFITAEAIASSTDLGMSFALDWLNKALNARHKGNRLAVFEVPENIVPLDLQGTEFESVDTLANLGYISEIIMPPDGT